MSQVECKFLNAALVHAAKCVSLPYYKILTSSNARACRLIGLETNAPVEVTETLF